MASETEHSNWEKIWSGPPPLNVDDEVDAVEAFLVKF